MSIKLGRKPRAFGDVLHLSQLRRRLRLGGPTVPAVPVDYTAGMPGSLGAMLNDRLGDCTIAGLYHRRQVVSFHTNPPMDTQPDSIVEKAYELIDGYNPTNPNSDQGGIEQEVLKYCVNTGMPLADGTVNKLVGFVEIDPANAIDVDWAISDCLGVYTGFNVPAFLMSGLTAPGSVWNVNPGGDGTIVGGHCVYVAGHLANGNRRLISWGATYEVTPAFWLKYFDEVYALVDADLIAARTGKSILGMTLEQTQAAAELLAA